MKKPVVAIFVGAILAVSSGCGWTESEAVGVVDPTSVTCPKHDHISFEDASLLAELVVHARPTESFFVDHCHRAFLLDVESLWYGRLPDHILAIVRIDPYGHAEHWADLGRGETAIFMLERDPEVPEAFRPLAEGAIVEVEGDTAHPCIRPHSLGCDLEPMELAHLHDVFDAITLDRPDYVDPSQSGDHLELDPGPEEAVDEEELFEESLESYEPDDLLDDSDELMDEI